jgi:allophanate hydrolase subunit 2
VATVCSFDVWRIGQRRPGQTLRFRAVTVAEAHRLLRDTDALLETAVREEIA